VRHSLASILGLCTTAVLSGQIEVVDVTEWVAAAPQELLAAMGARRNAAGTWVAPHPDTIERVFQALDGQDLADAAGRYLMAPAPESPPGPGVRAGHRPVGGGPGRTAPAAPWSGG
jgi:hypothetical protein